MHLEGHITGGVVVLDDATSLPEGTRVRIEPIPPALPTYADKFKNVIGKASSLPEDMAAQHDHYIHGSPRIIPPAITDPAARAKAMEELVARMKAQPLPLDAPKLTRDEMHERR
jgi:hypothetical protein